MKSEIVGRGRAGARGARRGLQAMAVAALLLLPFFANASAASDGKPLQVAYYYKVRWGFQQEFERLFLKNHYPLLQAQAKEGTRVKAVSLYRPTFHGEGGPTDVPGRDHVRRLGRARQPEREEALAKKLFPTRTHTARRSSGASRSSTRTGTCL